MIIAIDIDDVCANLLEEWLWRYRFDTGHKLYPDDIKTWHVEDHFLPEFREHGRQILFDDDLYDDVNPFPDAQIAVAQLRELGRVIFVTSCPNMFAAAHKFEWLERHGFCPKPEDYFVAKDKSLIRADVLFDDAVHNCGAFPGAAYLVTRTHNLSADWWPRITTMLEAPDIVRTLQITGIPPKLTLIEGGRKDEPSEN